MTIPHSLQRAANNVAKSSAILQDPATLRASNRPQLRRFEVASLLPNGNVTETHHIVPALPLFEEAFSAFSRGSLVDTEVGPIAVEDLLPGDRLLTQDGTAQTLMWKGSSSLIPGRAPQRGQNHKLTSFMADCFGLQGPMSCVIAGPAARVLRTPPHLRAIAGAAPLLTPVHEFHDGMTIVETAPPTPVEVFHLCLENHAVIKMHKKYDLPVVIFRCVGIYGPGSNLLVSVKQGRARSIKKTGLVFSRIHVEDLAQTLEASMQRPQPGEIYNVSNDHPSPPSEALNYACGLLNIKPPYPYSIRKG